MFEERPTKRVRRDELFAASPNFSSREGSPASVPQHQGQATIYDTRDQNIDYGFQYDLIDTTNEAENVVSDIQNQAKAVNGSSADPLNKRRKPGRSEGTSGPDISIEEAGEDEGLDFRLFASTSQSKGPTANLERQEVRGCVSGVQKVRIRSPTPLEASDGGFLNPHRPRSYYFAFAAAGDGSTENYQDRRATFRVAAVSGTDIVRLSTRRWYGMDLPWRITHVQSTSKIPKAPINRPTQLTESDVVDGAAVRHRTRPGKKRRIALRKRQSAKSTAEQENKEKKTRRNRERKVKKKMREKAKKAAEKTMDVAEHADGNEGIHETEPTS